MPGWGLRTICLIVRSFSKNGPRIRDHSLSLFC
jgi:hypothetical protein